MLVMRFVKNNTSFLDPQDQYAAAQDNLLATLSQEDRASVIRGTTASQQRAAGRGATLATEGGAVTSGGIPTTLVGEPSYLELIADVDARLGRVQEAQKAAVPKEPEKPDLIKAQRDEYFRTFFPGYTPAYQLNKSAESFLALPEDEKRAMIELFRSRGAGPKMAGTDLIETPSPSDQELLKARQELIEKGPQQFEKVDLPKDFAAPEPLDISQENIQAGIDRQTRLQAEEEILTTAMQELAIAQEELRSAVDQNDPEMVADAQIKIDKANEVLDRAIMNATATREQGMVAGEIREADRPFQYPIEKRGGENVPFFRKPGGRADVRAVEKRLDAEQRDKQFKIGAAEEAQKLYGTPDFDKMLSSEVGKAVSDLYEANKAKGDESGKEVLSYIAQEYPRQKDQRTAAVVFYGLGYGDKKSGYLGGEEEPNLGGGVVEQEEDFELGGEVVPAE